ncbi:MAG: hypothetical protein IV100_01935 [Myxococcales bacterium]|nr:hypothetical protein [Myxococcales bacterium]
MSRALALLVLLLTTAGYADELVQRTEDSLGVTLVYRMADAPFPSGRSRYKDDTVLVFVPKGFKAKVGGLLDVAVFFHGHFDTAENATAQKALREQLVKSRRNAVLVVPQLATNAHDSSAGKLEKPGGLARLLLSVQKRLAVDVPALGLRAAGQGAGGIGTVVVAGHSGGFQGAAFAVSSGGVPIRAVALFDAMYGFSARFARWLADAPRERRLVHVFRPGPGNAMVVRWTGKLRSALGYYKLAITDRSGGRYAPFDTPALFLETTTPHSDVPRVNDLFGEFLYHSSLP